MTIQTSSTTEAGRALKAKHRAMWAFGDYPAVATDLVSSLGPILVGACQVRPGDRVLDVAAGTGNAAIPAAEAGASVVASDLTPELLEAGQREAERRGTTVEWRQADAENLPFADGEFEVVMSCLGVMFAPHHQSSADELIRVCRPGGLVAGCGMGLAARPGPGHMLAGNRAAWGRGCWPQPEPRSWLHRAATLP